MAARIVVGFDGRDPALDALALARQLAAALDAELDLAAVLDYSPLPIDVEPYEQALRDHFEAIFDRAAALAGDERFDSHRLTGSSPADQLGQLSERLGAELIVIGSTHRGVIGRVLPGTTGDSLLSGGATAVAVAPIGHANLEQPIASVACGYDATPEADAALPLADALARALGVELELIAANSFRPPLAAEFANPLDVRLAERERLEAGVERARERFDSAAVAEVVDGDPATILIERSSDTDLLVLGSRGYGPLRRTLLGGVSSAVLRKAACPVIVVPRGAEAGIGGGAGGAAEGR
jgi:nucleotide-binding universal stress UspA family protein